MAQTQSTAGSQESQTNIYPNSDQIALWQGMLATEGGLANWLVNNPSYPGGVAAQVAAPTDLTNQLWSQAANTTAAPDTSGTTGQMMNLAGWMNQEMAPTSFNIQPGQLNFTNPFAGGAPTIGATAADYQYNPQQVSGPTVTAQQVQAPGAIAPLSGIAQVSAPSLQQYQMGPAQQVNAPNLSQFTMQAAAPIGAQQIAAPQSWTSPGTAQRYMDPYVQQAVNAQLAQAAVQNQQQINQQQGQAAQQGAFGGSREAIEEANQNLGYQQLASTIEAQGLQSAYQQGVGQFTAEQQMQMQQQQANQQAGLQAALANQQAQQQANVQNLSSFLQTQGLGAQTGLQAGIANQQAGLTVGQQNLAAQLQTQGLGAQLGMQAQLANQSTGLQTALANQQGQEFSAGQQLQAGLANQQANLQAAQATAGYNMQGQLANQASGLQAGLSAEQMGLQGAEANQAAQMQALLTQYQGGLQGALQSQNLGMQGQLYNAQLGLAGNQQNINNLMQQAGITEQAGQFGLAGYSAGLQGLGALGQVAQGQQGYQQQIADTQYQDWMNSIMLPFQAMGAYAGMAAQSPSWGQTTTGDTYTQGQTDQPTFNLGQLVGGIIQGGAQVGAAYVGAAKGGLMSIAEDGTARFDEGGLAGYAEGGEAEEEDGDGDGEIRTPDINFLSGTAKPGPWVTRLSPADEMRFQGWIKNNNIPFEDSPHSDYDMRGFWKAQQQGDPVAKTAVSSFDHRIHFPDVWKTPYHRSFSNESKYATPNAPHWTGDDESGYALRDKLGNVVYDERIQPHYDNGGLAAYGGEKASQFRRKLYGALRQHHNYPAARKSPQRFLDQVLSPESTGLGNLAYA